MVLNKVPSTSCPCEPACSDGDPLIFLQGYPAIERTDKLWYFTMTCLAVIIVEAPGPWAWNKTLVLDTSRLEAFSQAKAA